MDLVVEFIALVVVLLSGNMAARLLRKRTALLALDVAVLLSIAIMSLVMLFTGTVAVDFNLISLNPFSLFLITLFSSALLLVELLAYTYSDNFLDFSLLASFALVGMLAVAFSSSLITIFIGLELMTIPSVFMILLQKRSLESATKLFIMMSIAIAVLSFAIVLVYGTANSLALASLPSSSILLFASLLFLIALGFESSLFPFSILVPDIYQGAPAHITSMLGGINKKVGFAALLQVFILLFLTNSQLFDVVAVFAVVTMFFGNIVALAQYNMKRLMAYSSISQAGYILIGIATATSLGVSASLFQIFAHTFLFIGILAVLAWLESKRRGEVDDLVGLNSENRIAAFAIALFMLSLIGLPLTTGFIGKFLLFTSAVSANLTWLAIIGIVNSIISVYYYARVILAMYANKAGAVKIAMDRTVLIVVAVCLLLTFIFGVYPQPLISITNAAAQYLI